MPGSLDYTLVDTCYLKRRVELNVGIKTQRDTLSLCQSTGTHSGTGPQGVYGGGKRPFGAKRQ